ncbi:tyrosine-type recombinase/integrase [Acidobacterium sp. S8]|uniref:tyrosine-type recombinase/integrase n=1 Tax=Acidobacterium sp. S8 TaxID=1641854 RepID=UPI00131B6D7F
MIRVCYVDANGKPLKRWGLHNLRHSLGCWMVSNGIDLKTVASMLRHSNVRTTLGIHSQAVDGK